MGSEVVPVTEGSTCAWVHKHCQRISCPGISSRVVQGGTAALGSGDCTPRWSCRPVQVQSSSSRPVHLQGIKTLSPVIFLEEGQSPSRNRCPCTSVASGRALCISNIPTANSLLQPLLQRMKREKVILILVVPNWAHMIWFSNIPPLLHGTPLELPIRRDLLSQAQDKLFHPVPQGLKLWAWPLRGLVAMGLSDSGLDPRRSLCFPQFLPEQLDAG